MSTLRWRGKKNPRTALKWTYDPSKVQWEAEHGGFRWFLERRDGGDPRYPREYLYKTTLGGRGMDRVAKRDVSPALTPSARKRGNIQAKEWAEAFILSDLEQLGRALKNGKPKPRKLGVWKGMRADQWQKVLATHAWQMEYEGKWYTLTVEPQSHAQLWVRRGGWATPKGWSAASSSPTHTSRVIRRTYFGVPGELVAESPVTAKNIVTIKRHVFPWAEQHILDPLQLLAAEGTVAEENPRTSWARAGKKQRSTRRRRAGRRDIAERLPVTAKFEFVGSRGVTPEERGEWLADEREKNEQLANRYVRWATVHPKISEMEWEVAFGEGHPDYSQTRRGEFLRQSVLSVFRAVVERGDYAETQIWAIVRLAGGEWGYLEAGCDTTGWDCQSYNAFAVADKLSDLIPKLSDRGRHKLGLESDLQLLPLLARENRRR